MNTICRGAASCPWLLAGCTFQVGEAQPAPSDAGRSAARPRRWPGAAPAYAMTEHVSPRRDGARLSAVLLRQPGARGDDPLFRRQRLHDRALRRLGRRGVRAAGRRPDDRRPSRLRPQRGRADPGQSRGGRRRRLRLSDARLPAPIRRTIVVHGQSLGSFIAGRVAAERPTRRSRARKLGDDHRGLGRRQSARRPARWSSAPRSIRRCAAAAISPTWRAIEEPLLLLVGSRRPDHAAEPVASALRRLAAAAGAQDARDRAGRRPQRRAGPPPRRSRAYRAFLAAR